MITGVQDLPVVNDFVVLASSVLRLLVVHRNSIAHLCSEIVKLKVFVNRVKQDSDLQFWV